MTPPEANGRSAQLTLLAHGSPDPRHSRDVSAFARTMGARVAYLDHSWPSPLVAASEIAATGAPRTTVVPLFVGPAYHARVDVPEAVAAMRAAHPNLQVALADPVGLHPLLIDAAAELAHQSGLRIGADTGLILAATGSREPAAVAATEQFVTEHSTRLAAETGGREARVAFLDGGPTIDLVRAQMYASGCTDSLVVTWIIADGVLRDRILAAASSAGSRVVRGALVNTQALAALVELRADQAVDASRCPP